MTFEERTKLEKAANGVPLGAYIKAVLFDQDLKAVLRRGHQPVKDNEHLARVLAALGQSRLSFNLNQLARAAHSGSLPLDDETAHALLEACAAIKDMRADLITALGLQIGRGRS